jgi:hypothetical protein
MTLISTLQEAAGHPIEDLKKVIQKDPRIKPILQKHLALEDIENLNEFWQTLKFQVLNNRNVLSFVERRNNVKDMSVQILKTLRSLKPAEVTQRTIDTTQEFLRELFREHSYVENSGVSASTRKELVDWANGNGRYFSLSLGAQKELASVPGLRPTRPILLYRGLLFSSSDLKERKRYDGQLEVGQGLQFLRSVREGTRIVDLEWDRASSWTTSKETAMQFAKFGPASSNFAATMQWLDRSGKGKQIDGDLGFIVSTLAQPEDVLIDMHRLQTSQHLQHGDEGEMILKPGTYTCRISTKYTPSGEVDPTVAVEADSTITSALEAVKEFARTWLPETMKFQEKDWYNVDVERSLQRAPEEVLKYARRSTKDAALKEYGELRDLYLNHLKDLDPVKLQELQTDPKLTKTLEFVIALRKAMTEQASHPSLKTSENPRGKTTLAALSPEQARETTYAPVHASLKAASTGARYTDYRVGSAVNNMAQGFGGEYVRDLHRKGKAEQLAHLNKAIDGFFKAIDEPRPADQEEALKKVQNAILGAERNVFLINKIHTFRNLLDAAASSPEA